MKPAPYAFGTRLRDRLSGTRRIAVMGIGDENSSVDRHGMDVAREIDDMHIPGVRVFFAGAVPESMTGPLREFHPDHVIFMDAVDMGARPGTVAIIDPERIAAGHLSTHALPLSVVMDFIEKDSGTPVTLIGIQPCMTRPDGGLTADEQALLHRNLAELSGILREVCW